MDAIGGAPGRTDEQTIRDIDTKWSRAAENKDADKFVSFYSETGSAMPFNASIVTELHFGVWKKQQDGQWKAEAAIVNSDK